MQNGLHEVERRTRARLAAGDARAASRVCLEVYGPELFGFLLRVIDDDEAAKCVYADVSQRLASEISVFTWQCPLRTWIYAVAHRAIADRRRRLPREDGLREVHSGMAPTSTQSRRPAGIDALRRQLSEQDRELLILRIDRSLSWRDLSVIGLGERAFGEGAPHEELAREEAALRRRVHDIVRRIEEVVIGAGLAPSG
jgi:DNA-directed RNA polymerase specialized sigma24 family protein